MVSNVHHGHYDYDSDDDQHRHTPTCTARQTLHSQGEFDVGAAQPGDQVAFQEDPEADWVLGRVLSWMHETGQYEVRPPPAPPFPLPVVALMVFSRSRWPNLVPSVTLQPFLVVGLTRLVLVRPPWYVCVFFLFIFGG